MNEFQSRELGSFRIRSTAAAFPETGGRRYSNEEVHRLRYGDDWKRQLAAEGLDPDYYRTEHGFEQRYWTHLPGDAIDPSGLNSTDLMVAAGSSALKRAELKPEQIELVIAFTTTSPRYTSSVATIVAGRLGIAAPAFELKSGCSSALYSIIVGSQFIKSGLKNILIAGGDTLSRVTGLNSTHLYAAGDGGAALILSAAPDEKCGPRSALLGSNGSFAATMGVPGILPPAQSALDNDEYLLRISGKSAPEIEKRVAAIPEQLYRLAGVNASDVDCYLPHQANRKLIELGAEAAGLPNEKCINIVGEIANCGPSSILIALDRALSEKRIKPGDMVLFSAVGGGIAWGGLLFQF